MYIPPLIEALGLAEVEHNPGYYRMRALQLPASNTVQIIWAQGFQFRFQSLVHVPFSDR